MFHFKLFEIRLPEGDERVPLGEVYEDDEIVSEMLLRRDDGYLSIDTAFASSTINWGHPEKPVAKTDVSEERDRMRLFILRNQDRFSRISSAA